MVKTVCTRRGFVKTMALGSAALAVPEYCFSEQRLKIEDSFFIQPSELTLEFCYPSGARRLSFQNFSDSPEDWKQRCREKLSELLGLSKPAFSRMETKRQIDHQGVRIEALIMHVNKRLSMPGYFLVPRKVNNFKQAVIAIHGHGQVEPSVGLRDDAHHGFALELARAGHMVLSPEIRGFGSLRDLASGTGGMGAGGCRLDYWIQEKKSNYTLFTDGLLHGKTMIGQTIEDLLCWENWLVQTKDIGTVDVAGLSYGGDLALIYPVFSKRVRKIFASGTLGSFSAIYTRCYNAPAHCIPGILNWMDRSDIAGLNAPRPITLHYGELDKPGENNYSASYNETVEQSLAELREIYRAFGAENAVSLKVTPAKGHEMDNEALKEFLAT